MGVDVGSAVGYLDLDISGFLSGLKTAQTEAQVKTAKTADTIAKNFESAGKKMTSAGKTMSLTITTPIITAVTTSVNQFAKLEQAVGGVETMFKESASVIIVNSQTAYERAGVNAVEYMEQVTSFSARLLQSLGGDTLEAAKIADMAIVDMSDNANKFGSDIASIQDAYQGFAKDNFTMLDNLKLGYGGTKDEMSRLLEEATKLTGIEYDITQFDDIISAIHAIQVELGVTGTTSLEAATTVGGSIGMAKSAFMDFMAGLGDSKADINRLTKNMIDSFKNAVKNIKNVLVTIWENIPLDPWKKNVLLFVAAAGPALTILGKLSTGVAALISIYTKLKTALIAVKASYQTAQVQLSLYMAQQGLSTIATVAEASALTGKEVIVSLLTGKMTLATAAQWLWNAAIAANPIGLIIIAIAALIAAIVALIGWFKKESEEQKKLKKQIEETVEAHEELKSTLDSNAAAHKENVTAINNDYEASKRLASKIYDLSTAENKSATDKRVLASYIDDLNESLGETVYMYDAEKDQLTDSTGAIIENADAILGLIEARREQAETSALLARERELVGEMLLLEEGMRNTSKQIKELNEAKEAGTIKNKFYKEQMEILNGVVEEEDEAFAELSLSLETNSQMIEENAAKQTKAAPEIAVAWVAANGEVVESQDAMIEKNKELSEAIQSYVGSVTDMYNKISEKSKGSVDDYLKTLDHNYEASQRFVTNLDTLTARGLDAAIIENWRKAGVESAGEVAVWANATDDQIVQLNNKMARNFEQGTTDAATVMKIGGEDLVEGLVNGVVENIPSAAAAGDELADGVVDSAKDTLGVHSPSTVFDAMGVNLGEGLVKGINSSFPKVTTAIVSVLNKIVVEAKSASTKFLEPITSTFSQVPSKMKAPLDTAYIEVSFWSVKMVNKSRETVTSFVDNFMTVLLQLPGKAKGTLNSVLENTQTWSSAMGRAGSSAGSSLSSGVINETAGLPSRMVSVGQGIVNGVWSGIESSRGAFSARVRNFFSSIVNDAKSELGIHSPSTVFDRLVGRWIPAGIIQGVKNAMPTAMNQLQQLLNKGIAQIDKPEINAVFEDVTVWFESVESRVIKSVNRMVKGLTLLLEVGGRITNSDSGLGYVGYNGFALPVEFSRSEGKTKKTNSSGNGDTFNFYSPKMINEIEAARQLKKTKRDLSEGF